ncbi:MAG TPA: anaerobic glycerol-3-phosphate dehydrogenase subunit C [Miltoncostaeales bacterium]|nr:anaerobic glycerol-3-phosphate dehydrogenase subunit C [Miltoncostaeales bacterium]
MNDEMRASLDHCVKCTVCEAHCPVAAVTPLFPGPKYVGPQGERFRESGTSVDISLDYCSGCGICTHVCPQDVKIAEINAQARHEMKSRKGISVRDRLISRPMVTGRLSAPVAPIANAVLRNGLARRALSATLRIHRKAPLPASARITLRRWLRGRTQAPAKRGTIVYFHGCAANFYEVETGRMTIEVLEHLGYRVLTPKQGCCGLPLQSNGLFDDARQHVHSLVSALDGAGHGLPIVASSTSCGLMLKREAHEILGMEDATLASVGARTFDICEFLLDLHDHGELPLDLAPIEMTIPYHAPCQLRGHGIGTPAVELMKLIPGVTVVESNAACCGVAGTYGLKREKYDIAMAVGAPLFNMVRDMHPPLAVCDSETCRWQIATATGVETVHPIALIHRAYGLS